MRTQPNGHGLTQLCTKGRRKTHRELLTAAQHRVFQYMCNPGGIGWRGLKVNREAIVVIRRRRDMKVLSAGAIVAQQRAVELARRQVTMRDERIAERRQG